MKINKSYLAFLRAMNKSEDTIRTYSYGIRAFLEHSDTIPKSITTQFIGGTLIHMMNGLGMNSITLVRAAVKSYVSWLTSYEGYTSDINWEMVPGASGVVSDEVLWFPPEDIDTIIHNAPNIRAEAAWRLGYDIAIRVGELVTIPKSYYKPPQIRVFSGKKSKTATAKTFKVKLDTPTIKAINLYLKVWLPPSDLLFPYSRRLINRELRQTVIGLNLAKESQTVGYHIFRRSKGTFLDGILTISEIKAYLRHANIQTTSRHYIKKDFETVVADKSKIDALNPK